MNLIETLEWRYATKKMTNETITEDALNNILDATRLSASSYGLQPYTILVVSNAAIKKELSPAAYNQPQIQESSHLLVFCVWETITEEQVNNYIGDIAQKRGMQPEALKGFGDTIWGTVKNLPTEQQQVWAAKQAYIALGTALVAAANQQVDATPMEGFNPEAFDKILGLKEKGLKSVVLLALGVRSKEDELADAPKVRRAKELLYSFVD